MKTDRRWAVGGGKAGGLSSQTRGPCLAVPEACSSVSLPAFCEGLVLFCYITEKQHMAELGWPFGEGEDKFSMSLEAILLHGGKKNLVWQKEV